MPQVTFMNLDSPAQTATGKTMSTGCKWQGDPIGLTYGGTGTASTPSNGQLLIGGNNIYNANPLTPSPNIIVTNGVGTIALDLSGFVNGLRLTTASGTPVTISSSTTSTLYAVPFEGDRIGLYNTTTATWSIQVATTLSLTVPATANTVHDTFCYSNNGVPTLEAVAWANDTARATALTTQNGVYVKSGDASRRYLGTFRTATASQIEDSPQKRHLWNYYNRRIRQMYQFEPANSWTYGTATLRQANANTANQLDVVIGLQEDPVYVQVVASAGNSTANIDMTVAVVRDSTSAVADQTTAFLANYYTSPGGGGTNFATLVSVWHGYPSIGRHFFAWCELPSAGGTTTWVGDQGTGYIQSGLTGWTWG